MSAKAERAARDDGALRGRRAASTRTLIVVGAVMTLVGIALAVSDDEGFGGWLTVFGLLATIVALHRYGRLGADGTNDRVARRDDE